MGRTHSNAWGQVNRLFDVPAKAIMHTACDKVTEDAEYYIDAWGWQNFESDFSRVCANNEVNLVDLGTPNHLHAPMAAEAITAGKHLRVKSHWQVHW